MHSFPKLRTTTNPYLHQLWEAQSGQVQLHTFSWRGALRGRFDVLHVHWPELIVRSATRRATLVKYIMLIAVLVRIRVSGRALVRTVHNVRPHEQGSLIERAVLKLCDRWTSVFILLTPATPLARTRARQIVIPHGDYRTWYGAIDLPHAQPGRLGHIGHIRRYKGVEQLITAFSGLQDTDAQLRIAGSVRDLDLAAKIRHAAADDARISFHFGFLDDAALVSEIGYSSVAVLPYEDMLNSGAALLALSLARPVLVPDNQVTRALAEEVGPEWVMLYQGRLQSRHLEHALSCARSPRKTQLPDLSHRDWSSIGEQHVRAYQLALSTRSR